MPSSRQTQAISTTALAASHAWAPLSTRAVCAGRSSRHSQGTMMSKSSMTTNTRTETTMVAVLYLPVFRLCSAVR
jgi:hypothetical protein